METMFILLVCENDYDYNRKDIIGYSKDKNFLDQKVADFHEKQTKCLEYYEEVFKIRKTVDSSFPEIEKPNYKEKTPVNHMSKLSEEEQRRRRSINEWNRQLSGNHLKKVRERLSKIDEETFIVWSSKNDLKPGNFYYDEMQNKYLNNERSDYFSSGVYMEVQEIKKLN